jgi:hypothetical protein
MDVELRLSGLRIKPFSWANEPMLILKICDISDMNLLSLLIFHGSFLTLKIILLNILCVCFLVCLFVKTGSQGWPQTPRSTSLSLLSIRIKDVHHHSCLFKHFKYISLSPLCMCVCTCACECVCVCFHTRSCVNAGAHRGKKRMLNLLKLEL